MQRFFTFFFGFWFLVCLGQPASKPIPTKTSTAKETAKLEAELMAQFKAFAIRKRDYAKEIAAENKVKPPKGVWEFFDAVIAGDFAKAQKQFRPLARMSGQYDRPPPILGEAFWAAVTPKVEKLLEVEILDRWRKTIALQREKRSKALRFVWAPTMEVLGAMEAVDMWHAKYLRMYMKDIIESIPKGSIYYGGTDPGRFAITLGCKSHEKADPFFTITQNAFADGTYLQYLRELYEERIYMPTVEDNQIAFRTYYEDARARMLKRQLLPGENVTLVFQFQCTNCGNTFPVAFNQQSIGTLEEITRDGGRGMPCKVCGNKMSASEPRVQVQGNAAVMAINALLAKNIFNTNRENEFYLEESFPLSWMYPYMVPHGLIFKLDAEKEFEITSITPPKLPLPGFKVGDQLTPMNTQSDTRLEALSKGKFSIGAIGTNGVIQRIIVSDPGQYGIKPALATYAIGTATNVTSVRINVKMEPIKGTPFHRMVDAVVDPKFSGTGYSAGMKLFLHSITNYNPIQSLESKNNSSLTVKIVGERGSIKDILIKKGGGRYMIMPPTEITFANEKGVKIRSRVDFRRIPKYKKQLPSEIIAQNRKDWAKYMALCVGGAVVKPETTVRELCRWVEKVHIKGVRDGFTGDALFLEEKKERMEPSPYQKGPPFSEQKALSKMRSAQAALYAWHFSNTKDTELKARYAKETDFAYRQAFALGPINPEVSFKYVNFLSARGRFEDAKLIARTLNDTDPNSKSAQILLPQILLNQERQLVAKRDYVKAAEVALEMTQLDAKNPGHMTRHQYYQRIILQNRRFVSAFDISPSNTTNFLRVIQLYSGMRKTNEIVQAIELFSRKSKKNRINLTATKNAYGLIGDWKNKLKVDLELAKHAPDSYAAWFDLAQTQMRLKQTNESTQAMLKALALFEKAKIKTPDIIPILRTNALLKPLREQPEIKKILRNN